MSTADATTARRNPTHAGGRMLFSIPFACPMSDADVALLARLLQMNTHMHPKLHGNPAGPGTALLDFDSGLFLRRGEGEGHWTLEGRTWGNPAAPTVHEWEIVAADVARRLDPTGRGVGDHRAASRMCSPSA